MAQDAVPAWFEPAMTTLLAPIRITLAQTRNFHFLDGSIIPFMIVPFNDGSMPTEAPHNLLPLVNVAAVRALTEAQTTAYAVGYALGNVGPAPAGRAAIGRAVGCTVPVDV